MLRPFVAARGIGRGRLEIGCRKWRFIRSRAACVRTRDDDDFAVQLTCLPGRLALGVDKDRVDAIGLHFLHIRQKSGYNMERGGPKRFMCVICVCVVATVWDM